MAAMDSKKAKIDRDERQRLRAEMNSERVLREEEERRQENNIEERARRRDKRGRVREFMQAEEAARVSEFMQAEEAKEREEEAEAERIFAAKKQADAKASLQASIANAIAKRDAEIDKSREIHDRAQVHPETHTFTLQPENCNSDIRDVVVLPLRGKLWYASNIAFFKSTASSNGASFIHLKDTYLPTLGGIGCKWRRCTRVGTIGRKWRYYYENRII